MSEWTDRLLPASFRGVPFAVRSASGRFGRRQAVHEYPFRDTVWVEDLGRNARRLTIDGFLIENSLVYGGGDVILQKDRMIARRSARFKSVSTSR
jgi:prophage DNA circulation protein